MINKTTIETIKTAILESQYKAAKEVNAIQLSLYFSIGKYVSENTRKGFWGTGALEYISEQLQCELPGLRGFSATNLKMMRIFYEEWANNLLSDNYNSSPKSDELTSISQNIYTADAIVRFSQISNYGEVIANYFLNISFTHHKYIITMVKGIEERLFYIELAAKESLSVRALQQAIRSNEYHHKGTMPNNFIQALSASQQALKAIRMFKDEYLLDFINIEALGARDIEEIDERVVEQQIVQNIKHFIMTFGRDFAFIGNQYHLEIYGVEQFPDLLFFNRELNAMVVVELKLGEFKTSYLGQLFGYLQILDDHVRKPHENPSIGIVLCQTANHSYAQYAVRDYTKPMGVATYKTLDDMPEKLRKALPDVNKMIEILKKKG